MEILRFSLRIKKKHFGKSTLLFFIFVVINLMMPSPDLMAIHAIFKGAAPIPRRHGPVSLSMAIEEFLQTTRGVEVSAAIGQFPDEHRFELDHDPFPEAVTQVLSDFYKGRLFRIEINYKSVASEASPFKDLIEENSRLYGPPRVNSLPGVQLIFWDDGATRMIMEVDEKDQQLSYSLTYIDDDLFHQASRDRVQRETAGQSSYGK